MKAFPRLRAPRYFVGLIVDWSAERCYAKRETKRKRHVAVADRICDKAIAGWFSEPSQKELSGTKDSSFEIWDQMPEEQKHQALDIRYPQARARHIGVIVEGPNSSEIPGSQMSDSVYAEDKDSDSKISESQDTVGRASKVED